MNCGNCELCLEGKLDQNGWPLKMQRMIVCSNCGNKRCPRATDHRLECTNSNEPGQKGSSWENYKV
jgi:ribosomal protein L32